MNQFVVMLKLFLLMQVGIVLSWDTPRITEPGEFPYIVGIMWQPNEMSTHFSSCAAAILNEYWYLSSGYCTHFIPNMGHLVIKAGSHDISRNAEHDQIIRIARFVVHDKYTKLLVDVQGRPNLVKYDIGLLKGRTPLIFNNFVKPINLPKPKTLLSDQKLEYNLIASGWGLFPENLVEEMPKVMRSIRLPIVPSKVCQNSLRNLFMHITLSDMQMCTRPLNGSIGACIANYGGPLILYNKRNEPIVVGVVSWSSLACNTNNLPPIYIRVSHFVSWIKSNIKQ